MGLFETVASSLFHMLTFIFFVLILLLMLYAYSLYLSKMPLMSSFLALG